MEMGDGNGEPQPPSEKGNQGTMSTPETYAQHVRQVMEAADWPWPEHVLLHPAKQPRFVYNVEEFMYELRNGCHMDQVVVFPGGIEALGHQNALGEEIANAAGFEGIGVPPKSRNAYEVLENLAESGTIERFKGKVQYRAAAEDRSDVAAGGRKNKELMTKWESLRKSCPEEVKESVYIAELRRLQSQPHDDGLRTKRKSSMAVTMRERMHRLGMDVRSLPFWDDFSEGCFCGAGQSGYDLHVDIIPSSNVGSVFAGHKLLALWGFPHATRSVMKKHRREHFTKPLTSAQVEALEGACCVAMAPPGSIYLFSGCNAHTVCNIGFTGPSHNHPPERSLIISSYEAYVNLHKTHLAALSDTCQGKCRIDSDDESDSDIAEFEDDIADGACEIQRRLLANQIQEPEAPESCINFLGSELPRVQKRLEDDKQKLGNICERSPEGKRRKRDSPQRDVVSSNTPFPKE